MTNQVEICGFLAFVYLLGIPYIFPTTSWILPILNDLQDFVLYIHEDCRICISIDVNSIWLMLSLPRTTKLVRGGDLNFC